MFCPQCGQQQQAFEAARFCSRCGFQLAAVAGLLATGGVPRELAYEAAPAPDTPRRKGARLGGKLMLSGLFLMPVLGILSEVIGTPGELALFGLLAFMAGLFRLLYAFIFEDGPFRRQLYRQQFYAPPAQFAPPREASALQPPPQQQGTHAHGYAPPRVNTADLSYRPSVTEGPTRLLDRERDDQPR